MLFRLSEICKSYTQHDILRGVSFQVNVNEKIGLVGRNGAGKTTVFRIITGEESPDSGDVIKMNNLKIGLLSQHVEFTDNETVHTSALSAFKRIHDIEAEMKRLEKLMETEYTDEILEQYGELQHEFEVADGFSYAAKAESILLGLGFPRETWTLETKNLSGGQKNRLGMARLLLADSDVLLLDEPTNHLDVAAVEWLETFLQTYDKTYVIISHDRYFLDRTSTKIIEIENGKAVLYKGNYSQFLVEREERREIQRREFENQQAYIKNTEAFVRKNLEGQKTKQAKSRRTMLQKLERVEAVVADKPQGNFNLKKVERAGLNVLTVEDLAVGYGEKVLAKGMDFTLNRGEALGVIGGNGTGKTTFLKTVLGNIRELAGKINWGAKTDIGYYSQNLEDLDARNEVIQELRRVAPMAENGQLRGFLARFLFTGEDVFKSVKDLSGGEKGRLALAKLIYSNKNVLILDEPTNHLDIPSREALESALDVYEGTIITVSHDRFFLDKVSTQILSFEDNGKIEIYDGNYSDFHDWKLRQIADGNWSVQEEKIEIDDVIAENQTTISNKEPLSKNQQQRIETRIKEIESTIQTLDEELAKLSVKMTVPEVVSDHGKLLEVNNKYQETETKIQKLYEEWDKLSADL